MATGPEWMRPSRANLSRPSRSTTASRSSSWASSEKSGTSRSRQPGPLGSRTARAFSFRQTLVPAAALGDLPLHLDVAEYDRHLHEGRPSPSVQKAMLTPSAVWAYWMRGSTSRLLCTANSRCGSPTPFSACSPRSSNATPADVRARPRTVSDTSTSPGAERRSYPRRDVHRAAVDVVPLSDDVTGVDAEVQLQPQGLACGVAAEGAVDGLASRRETASTPSPSTLPSTGVPPAVPDD